MAPREASRRPYHLLTVSARSRAALDAASTRLADHLAAADDDLADVAFTLAEGRRAFAHRRVVAAESRAEASALLKENDPRRVFTHVADKGGRTVAFMFPGGGAQYPRMALGLYQSEPVFREWMDRGIEGIRAGVGTDEVAGLLPKAEEFGFGSEMEAFGLQFAHGLGLGLHERPIISRLNSMKEPVELQVGMVFALETYCPASDGFSAARIEEEIVLTEDGPQVLTLFPAQDLFVANPY